MNNKKKNIILSIVVILVGLALVGGTYAYLTFSMNVTNNVVNGGTTCFDIDYIDNTDQITGTLFPSANHTKGLTGTVSLKIKNTCNLDGVGNLYLHVNNNTSNLFITTAAPHCENKSTLETLTQYTTSGTCNGSNRSWVTTGTPLKYAVYGNSTGTGTPLSVGYVNAIDSDIAVYKDFVIKHTQKDYYIFLWLDGHLTDNTYTNLSFDGYVKVDATQARTVYTANVVDSNIQYGNLIPIGSSMPNWITEYSTQEEAMAYLKSATGGTTDYPFFLKHTVGNIVVESYVGFVITPDMAANNSGLTAGTYYLNGGDDGNSFLDNAKTLYDAFGGANCYLDSYPGGNPYITPPSYEFICEVANLLFDSTSNGSVTIFNTESSFGCFSNGYSGCQIGF